MSNTRSLLLIAIITATMVMGTSVIPMQSYADRGDNDDRKKDKDYKSKISASYESDEKSLNQDMDQDNFCYRGDDCEQANQGQQLAGKENEATGFNDQSDNLVISAVAAGNGTTPTPPTPTPIPTCVECFTGTFTPEEIAAIEAEFSPIQTQCATQDINEPVSASDLIRLLERVGISNADALEFVECLRTAGFNIVP